jgi:hypothetical protein
VAACEETVDRRSKYNLHTPLYLLNTFSRSVEGGVCAFSRLFMYDCRAISRRRCLSRYRLASRELDALDFQMQVLKRGLNRGAYEAPVTLTNSLRSLSFLETRDCPEDGGDERE